MRWRGGRDVQPKHYAKRIGSMVSLIDILEYKFYIEGSRQKKVQTLYLR